jgi:hypothetical protein
MARQTRNLLQDNHNSDAKSTLASYSRSPRTAIDADTLSRFEGTVFWTAARRRARAKVQGKSQVQAGALNRLNIRR